MASVYRKEIDCQTWHFCSNCSHWLKEGYEEQTQAPGTGQLCNECRTLRLERNCE